MTKTSFRKIKEQEKEIIGKLQENSGQSIDVLSKKLGFSRQKVWRFMKRLEQGKIVWGYTAVVDPAELNRKHFTMMLKGPVPNINIEVPGIGDKDVTVESMYYVNGFGFDWQVEFTATDIAKAKDFCIAICGRGNEYLLFESLFIVKKHHITNPVLKKKVIDAHELKGLI